MQKRSKNTQEEEQDSKTIKKGKIRRYHKDSKEGNRKKQEQEGKEETKAKTKQRLGLTTPLNSLTRANTPVDTERYARTVFARAITEEHTKEEVKIMIEHADKYRNLWRNKMRTMSKVIISNESYTNDVSVEEAMMEQIKEL